MAVRTEKRPRVSSGWRDFVLRVENAQRSAMPGETPKQMPGTQAQTKVEKANDADD
jgi:hypothetical protein